MFLICLGGCITVGYTREETEKNIQEAIIFHLEGMKEDWLSSPAPETERLTMRILGIS
jgi:predicted RNase H-like HicB family nuclease